MGKVPTIVTSKICLKNDTEVDFEPFEVKRISLCKASAEKLQKMKDFVRNDKFQASDFARNSPFKIESINLDDNTLTVSNIAPVNVTLCDNVELSELPVKVHHLDSKDLSF